jgi:ribose transport system ATP-binding protein
LEIDDVSTASGHRGVSLSVRAGEIVGLYGLVGAGRSELAKAVLGLDRITSGEVRVRGEQARIRDVGDALCRCSRSGASDQLGIRVSSVRQPAGQLSGGNQQKVSLAKWLAAQTEILIIDLAELGA